VCKIVAMGQVKNIKKINSASAAQNSVSDLAK
jgi:hypothetical protein